MAELLTQEASIITDGVNNYTIQNGVWTPIGDIPALYADKVTFFTENGFKKLNKAQLSQLKTQLTSGKGKFLTLAKADLVDFFGDGSGLVTSSFDETTDDILIPVTGTTVYKPTPFGNGLYFSGNDLYSLPASVGLTEYTISFYMAADQNSSGNTVVYGDFYYLMLYSGYLMIQQSGIIYTDKPNELGKRTHVTLSLTNTKAEIYLDGVLSAVASLTNAVKKGTIYVGGVPSGSGVTFPFVGVLDTFRFFNRTVTASEAMELATEVV